MVVWKIICIFASSNKAILSESTQYQAMKKAILLVVLALLSVTPTMAQDALKFGYLSYNTVLQVMPEYAAVQANMAELRQKYEAE